MNRPTPISAVCLTLALLVLLGVAGCGGGDDSTATTETAETTATGETTTAEIAETLDEPAPLPNGWAEEINQRAGFSIGVPPDWSVRETQGGQGSVLTSPDGLIALSVTADRTRGALELPLDEFAIRTTEALGSEVVGAQRLTDLDVGIAAPFDHEYEAVGVRAFGTSNKTGVREAILVVVVRREGQAAYVIIDRENVDTPSKVADRATIKEIIRSLRGRPPA